MGYKNFLLGDALSKEYDYAPGIVTKDGVLHEWPEALGARPSDADLENIVKNHEQEKLLLEKMEKGCPSIRDQLEALWRAMDEGILPKVDGFYDKISNSKNKCRKK